MQRLCLTTAFLLLSGTVLAGGCPPAPPDGDLPPCCATTDMSGGGRCAAPARQYQLTLHSIGFERSDGSVLRFGSPRLFDAAGVSAGNVVGTFLSRISLPPGSYKAVLPVLNQQVSLSVNSLTAEGRRCTGNLTTPIKSADGSPYPACGAGQPDASSSICHSGGLLKLRDSSLGIMTVSTEQSLALDLRIDVNNAVICEFAPGTDANLGLSHGSLSVKLQKN